VHAVLDAVEDIEIPLRIFTNRGDRAEGVFVAADFSGLAKLDLEGWIPELNPNAREEKTKE